MAEDYDILPHNEVARLKNEISKMKGGQYSGQMNDSLDKLSGSIDALLSIFRQAYEDMKLDQHDTTLVSNKIEPLLAKLDRVLEQNEKIAKGIVALADMLEDAKRSSFTMPQKPNPAPILPSAPPMQPQFSQPMAPSFPSAPIPSTQAMPQMDTPRMSPRPLPTTHMPALGSPEKKKEPLIKFKFK